MRKCSEMRNAKWDLYLEFFLRGPGGGGSPLAMEIYTVVTFLRLVWAR